MANDDGRKKKKKKRSSRRGNRSEDALDEEAPLPIDRGEAEFAGSATFNADNAPVVVPDDEEPLVDAAPLQPSLVPVDDDDAIPAPIAEPDAAGGAVPGEGGFTDDGLAVATAIDAGAEDEFIYAAIEYDPDSKPPLYKNRRFRVYTCLALMVVVAVVAVVVVYVTKSAKGTEVTEVEQLWEGDPSVSPTAAPTTNREASGIKEQVEAGILQRGANFTGMDRRDPRYMALEWILHADQLQLDSDDVNLYQRYVLALLAFSMDSLAWYKCGDHRVYGNETEEFAQEDCQIQNEATGQIEQHKVWLSSTDECEWYGVICSQDHVVRGVELMGNSLIGEIPPEISQLRFLQYLALNGNCLYGTLPPEFGKMPNLLSLELHGNGLSGDIPVEIFDASKLQLLNVAMQFGWSTECQRSDGTYADTLYRMADPYAGEYNYGLSGMVLGPNVSSWASMKGLHIFDNSFYGWMDEEIGNLKYLVFLRAANNYFSEWLPHGMGKLKKLRELYISKNNFREYIPWSIEGMEDLEDIRVNENALTGTIPPELYSLKKLKYLWLQDTVHNVNNVSVIDSTVGFNGTISEDIGKLKKLTQLLINNNPIGGTMPTEIGRCENLAVLHIHKTNIKGKSPNELCALRDKNLNNDNGRGVFYSDCRPDNRTNDPYFACHCCSDCCDHTTKVCIADD